MVKMVLHLSLHFLLCLLCQEVSLPRVSSAWMQAQATCPAKRANVGPRSSGGSLYGGPLPDPHSSCCVQGSEQDRVTPKGLIVSGQGGEMKEVGPVEWLWIQVLLEDP